MFELAWNFFKEEEGQGLAEYGLILALVGLAVVTAMGEAGASFINLYNYIHNHVQAAAGGP